MSKVVLVLLAVFTSVFSVILPMRSSAENAQIREVLVTKNSDTLLVYAKVVNCFKKDMEAAILAGVPTTFTFYIDLYQQRSFWWDKRITSVEVRHTLKYDSVKKIFLIHMEDGKQAAEFQEFESAKAVMAELNGVDLGSTKRLEQDRLTYVRLKAKLDRIRLPLHLEYVFFFVSLWDFETDWHKYKISY